jgi:5-methylcytosine-specific restriction endonuclease McrA
MENEVWYYEKNGKRRRGKVSTCECCGNEFVGMLNREARFCGCDCARIASRKRVALNCDFCGKQFDRAISKSRTELSFCSRLCKEKAQSDFHNDKFSSLHLSHYTGGNCPSALRGIFMKEEMFACKDCGITQKFLLHIHHIDGDRANSDRDNIEILCCNCHAKRHLVMKNGEWVYNPKKLTPRNLISDIKTF